MEDNEREVWVVFNKSEYPMSVGISEEDAWDDYALQNDSTETLPELMNHRKASGWNCERVQLANKRNDKGRRLYTLKEAGRLLGVAVFDGSEKIEEIDDEKGLKNFQGFDEIVNLEE